MWVEVLHDKHGRHLTSFNQPQPQRAFKTARWERRLIACQYGMNEMSHIIFELEAFWWSVEMGINLFHYVLKNGLSSSWGARSAVWADAAAQNDKLPGSLQKILFGTTVRWQKGGRAASPNWLIIGTWASCAKVEAKTRLWLLGFGSLFPSLSVPEILGRERKRELHSSSSSSS